MLRVRLIGALEVELNGTEIDTPASQRPWSLFAYLALEDRSIPRQELATRFWPDVLDQSARASLRSALWALRRHLGGCVPVSAEGIWLEHPDGVWVDAREFARLAPSSPADALAMCRGELLAGVPDEWALLARERHRGTVVELLERLAQDAELGGNTDEALDLTRRQVQTDPFDEGANRRLIDRLDRSGDRGGAARAYQGLAERLRRELGVAPSAATRALGERLRPRHSTPASAPARAPGPLPLVGRDREFGALQRAWQEVATAGTGAVVVVRGEAGVGKTRLVSELRHQVRAAGARTAASAALDLGGTAPLSLWAELLAELLPTVPAPAPEVGWPGDLGALVGGLPEHFAQPRETPVVAPDLQRTRLFEAVVAALQWAVRTGPLLLILEDVHAADGPSLELTGYAARRLAPLPVMVVITRRDRPRLSQADVVEQALRARGLLSAELELGPLAPQGVAALARATARLSPAEVERVLEAAEGNALFALETARALHSAGGGGAGVASSLRGSVASTLGRLTGESRMFIDLLAVAARPITTAELRALHVADPDQAAGLAFDTGLLDGSEHRIGFRHALLRDAAYGEMAAPRRAMLHHRWATALASIGHERAPAGASEIARHLRLGGADAEAVPFLAQAARGARAMGALAPAIGYLEEAVGIEAGDVELWLELGGMEAWRHHRADAERAFARAIDLAGDAHPLSAARAWLGRARAFHGPLCVPRLVLDSATRALDILRRYPDAVLERQEALGDTAWSEAVGGDVARAEALIDELAAMVAPGDHLAEYHVSHARALALMRRGRFAESCAASIAAGEAIDRAGRPDLGYGCWANAAGAANAAGDPDQALAFLARGLDAMRGHGLTGLELQTHGFRAFVLARAGRLDDAQAAVDAQREIADALGDPELSAVAAHDGGLVALEVGDYPAAEQALSAALHTPSPISRPTTRLALAEALARAGDPQRAIEEVRAAVLEPVVPSDFPAALVPRMYSVQGFIALGQGDRGRAEHLFGEAVEGWTRLLSQAVESKTLVTVLADLGRPVVGLIEPERERRRALANLELARTAPTGRPGGEHAVVP